MKSGRSGQDDVPQQTEMEKRFRGNYGRSQRNAHAYFKSCAKEGDGGGTR